MSQQSTLWDTDTCNHCLFDVKGYCAQEVTDKLDIFHWEHWISRRDH